ncbi:zinc-binding dehydrogenase [bacterium]|nr:zinc-binding dehydrogenase [bacterium]
MKSIRIRSHGDYDTLRVEDISRPAPGIGEILLEMRYSALNHLDTWVRRGVPGHKFPLPITPGSDGSGVIAELGEGVEGFVVGERIAIAPGYSCGKCEACLKGKDHYCRHYGIYGESTDGCQCEYFVLPISNSLKIPEGLSLEAAAAIPLVFLTAWEMLVAKARIREGDTVLVHAAGSGVGSASIQIARHFGARVIATAGSEAKLVAARELGAHETIHYVEADFAMEVRRITEKRGVDIVVEHTGAATFAGSLRSLAGGGRIVTCGATSGAEITADLRPIFFKNLSILGSTMGRRDTLPEILRLAAAGSFRAVIDRVLPVEDVAEAHRAIAERAQIGKVLLKMGRN